VEKGEVALELVFEFGEVAAFERVLFSGDQRLDRGAFPMFGIFNQWLSVLASFPLLETANNEAAEA
jgi:hypothetical protein